MIAAILATAFVFGALLRRVFGGWLGLSRSLCAALIIGASAAPAWWAWGGFEPWPVPLVGGLPMWAKALLVTGLAAVFWTDGHRFDRPWMLLGRYGWPMIPLAAISGVWAVLAVGPVVAGAAVLARWYATPVELPWDDAPEQQMADGWTAWWEIVLGGVGMCAFWSAALL